MRAKKWRAGWGLRVAGGLAVDIGCFDTEDEAQADLKTVKAALPRLAEEVGRVSVGERCRCWARLFADVLGHPIRERSAASIELRRVGAIQKGKDTWRAEICIAKVTVHIRTHKGPGTEEKAAADYNAIAPHRHALTTELKGKEDRHEIGKRLIEF